jgi:hypothetical protein
MASRIPGLGAAKGVARGAAVEHAIGKVSGNRLNKKPWSGRKALRHVASAVKAATRNHIRGVNAARKAQGLKGLRRTLKKRGAASKGKSGGGGRSH